MDRERNEMQKRMFTQHKPNGTQKQMNGVGHKRNWDFPLMLMYWMKPNFRTKSLAVPGYTCS